MNSKIGKRVRILGGMREFVGKIGTIVDSERDGPTTTLCRVKLDTAVEVEGVGRVTDDLWAWEFLEPVSRGRRSTSNDVRYPNVSVRLVGEDGNAFSILGRVTVAMRKGGVPREARDEFRKAATSGDYDHLLATCCEWVNCS